MRKKRAASSSADDSALTLDDPNSLDLLVRFGYLDADAVARLRSLGIATCTQLVFEVRRNANTLQRQLGLDEKQLLLAGAAARLLNFTGPGSIMMRQFVMERAVETLADDDIEMLRLMINEPQSEVVEYVGYLFKIGLEAVEPIDWRKQWRTARGILVGLLFIIAAQFASDWNRLFPAATDNALRLALDTLRRANAWDGMLALFVGLIATMLILWLAPLLVGRIFSHLIDWLDARTMSLADYPILHDAAFTLSPRERNRNRWILGNFLAIYCGMILGLAGLNYIIPLNGLEKMLGLAAAVVIAAGLTALFARQKHAFQRLIAKAHWGEETDRRYARALLGRFGVTCLLTLPVVFATMFFGLRLTVNTATAWAEQRYVGNLAAYEQAIDRFEPPADEAADWIVNRPDWVQAGQNNTTRVVGELNQLRTVVEGAMPGVLQAVIAGMWGCGLLFVFVELRYADRKKGVAAAVIWVAMAFIGELLPGPIAQSVFRLPEGTVQAVIAVIAVASLLGIMSEQWVSGERPGTRACANPRCDVRYQPIYGEDDIVCSKCGARLGEAVDAGVQAV